MNDIIKHDWIHRQHLQGGAQFDQALSSLDPDAETWVKHARLAYQRTCVDANYLKAVAHLDWRRYIRPGDCVLDLAAGIGWLSAYLSRETEAGKIYYLDSSRYYVNDILPRIVDLMGGRKDKLEAFEAVFYPLLFHDGDIDTIVVSSSLHHAENMGVLMAELNRVLRAGGYLLILNETPLSTFRYLAVLVKRFSAILRDTLLKRYLAQSPTISSSGVLYDPVLGDRVYPNWYWEEAVKNAGFILENTVDTGMATIDGSDASTLTHYICRKPMR